METDNLLTLQDKLKNKKVVGKILTPELAVSCLALDLIDELKIRDLAFKLAHPDGPKCPHCHCLLPDRHHQRFWSGKRLKCPQCDRFFTASTKTVYQGSRLSIARLYLLAVLLGVDVSISRIADILGISPETVRHWQKRFSEAA